MPISSGWVPSGPCRDRTPDWGACLARNYGRAQWVDDGILAARGEPTLAILDPSGDVVRELDTGLRDVYLMEFAVTGSDPCHSPKTRPTCWRLAEVRAGAVCTVSE